MNWIKEHKILTAILGIALVLRVVGIGYGLPYFFVGDEQSQLGAALVMLKNFNLIPGTAPEDFKLLYYPPIMSYFYLLPLLPGLLIWKVLGGLSFGELTQEVVLNSTIPWLIGRLFIVAMGVLSVYLVYLLGRRVFADEKIGLLSAFFLATSFFHVSLSHFTRHWVPTTFFEILSMIAAFNIWQYGRRKDYFWSAIFSSLSFGVGFIGIISAFFSVVAHFGRRGIRGIRETNFWVFVATLILLVAGIILLYPQRFLEISQGTDVSVAQDKTLQGFFDSIVFHFRALLLADPTLFVLAITGIVWGIRVRRGITLAFVIYTILYVTSLYFVIHNEPRYISFLYPGLAILAALPVALFFNKLRSARLAQVISGFLLIIFLGYPLAVATRFSFLLSQDDTRILAKKWIEKNIQAGVKIISFLKPEVLVPSPEAIRRQKDFDSSSLRTYERALLELAQSEYPKSYNLSSILKLSSEKLNLAQVAQDFEPEYSLVQYWNLEDYLKIPSKFKSDPQALRLASGTAESGIDFTGNFEVPTFILFRMKKLGPVVEIHKL